MDKNLMAKDQMKNLGLEFPSKSNVQNGHGTTESEDTGAEKANA